MAYGGTPVIMFGKATVIQDWLDHNAMDGASQGCNFSVTSTLYLGSQEERQLYLPNPMLMGLGGMVSVAMLSPKAASLPPYTGNKLGLRPSIIAMLMLRAGLEADLETRKFLSVALCAHPKQNCAFDLVAAVATTFPRWQVSITVPPEAVKHFSKDMEIAKTAEEGTAGQELTLEIGRLVKGTVLDATNIQR